MLLMIVVVVCYTFCSISDKVVVSKENINGDEFSFFLAMSTVFFLSFYLPFSKNTFHLNLTSCFLILSLVACKIAEIKTIAVILAQLSAFEVKAWLGSCVFMSYIAEIFLGNEGLSLFKIVFILITIVGLFFIVNQKERNVNYKSIARILPLYIFTRFIYGVIMKQVTIEISSTLALYITFIIMMIIMAFKVKPVKTFKEKTKGVIMVCGTRFVNVIGTVVENVVISISLVNYSFIQPLILVTLFFMMILKKEKFTKFNLIGSVLSIFGIVGFEILRVI